VSRRRAFRPNRGVEPSAPRNIVSSNLFLYWARREWPRNKHTDRLGGLPKSGTLPGHVPLAVNTVVKARCVREIIVRRCFSEMMLSEMFKKCCSGVWHRGFMHTIPQGIGIISIHRSLDRPQCLPSRSRGCLGVVRHSIHRPGGHQAHLAIDNPNHLGPPTRFRDQGDVVANLDGQLALLLL